MRPQEGPADNVTLDHDQLLVLIEDYGLARDEEKTFWQTTAALLGIASLCWVYSSHP